MTNVVIEVIQVLGLSPTRLLVRIDDLPWVIGTPRLMFGDDVNIVVCTGSEQMQKDIEEV